MAQTIKVKRSAVAGKVPTTSDLELGELALNTYDGKLYTKKDNGIASIVEVTPNGLTDTNIASGAEIAVNKLADGASRQLLQTDAAGTGVEWTSNVDIPGTLDVTGAATFDSTAAHPLGSAAAPTVTFTGDPNTGIYSPGADQVAISTGGTERFRISSDGSMSAVIPGGSTLYPASMCRAWVNFNGTGTVAIRASYNVSSITDNGVGDYMVNFTAALTDTNYSVLTTTRDDGTSNFVDSLSSSLNNKTTTELRVICARRSDGVLRDSPEYNVAIFR